MKKSFTNLIQLLLLFVVFVFAFVTKLQAQVTVTATAGTTSPTIYTTVNGAFTAINSGTHQGAVLITVTGNTTEPATPVQLVASGVSTANYQSVKIVPQGNVTINSAATPTASRGILEFIGADSVTIDGDDPLTTGVRNLTIQMASTSNAGTACIRFSSSSATTDGCTKATVRNCNINGGRNTSTGTTSSFGIFSGLSTAGANITTASGAANNDSMLIENNSIQRCYYGIYTFGMAANLQRSLIIRNNIVGTNVIANSIGFRGIFIANTQTSASTFSAIIEGNDIRIGDTINGLGTNIAALDLNISNAGAIVRNNFIHDVANPSAGGWGSYGIFLSSATNNSGIRIFNNIIKDVYAFHYVSSSTIYANYGIYSTAALTGLKIYHNTISLVRPNAGSGNSNYSACVYLSSTTLTLAEFTNNIFVNKQSDNTGQACLGVFLGSANQFSTGVRVNNNNYFVNGVSGFIGSIVGTNYLTLANWKTATTKDSLSLNFDPAFISSTNLHLTPGVSSPFESAGALTDVLLDIDGDARPGPFGSINGGGLAPDIGADEADMGLPSIATMATGTKVNITTNSANLTGVIVNNGGSAITASGIIISLTTGATRFSALADSATNPLVDAGSFNKTFSGLSLGTTYYYRSYAVNSIGTSYGPDSSFTTNSAAVVPTVLKISATNVQGLSATVGGNITSDGGSPILASGIVYATTANPVLLGLGVVDSTTNPLVLTGIYSKPIGGLLHSTKYYYRAYATNSIGTAYSVQDSFTTQLVISTLPYFESFDSTATPWATTALNAGTNAWVRGTPAKTNLSGAFSAPNAFVTFLTGNYSGTEDCAILSPQMNFSSLTAAPILRFRHEMDVDSDIGYDGGIVEISINGGAWTRLDPTAGTPPSYNTTNSSAWYNNTSGFGTLGSPIWSANTATTYPSTVNGWISSATPLTGAAGQSNVRVRFRFWADGVVDEGWAIDNIEIFEPTAPTVQTATKTNITTSTVTLGGNITNNGGNAITASGVVVGTSPSPTRGSFGIVDSATNPLVVNGTFNLNIAGLLTATTYYYRAYAVNAIGTSYGPDSSFTTNSAAVVPTVLRIPATNIQGFSATVGGNITSDGGSVVTASGIVYATTTNPLLLGFGVVDSTTNPVVLTGIYSINPAGLLSNTKYYYKAYAINGVGTAYSAQDSFTTPPVISVLPYSQNFDSVGNTGWGSNAVTGVINPWVLGTPTKTNFNSAFSAPNAWVTSLSANYANGTNAALTSPQFNFAGQTADPILRFQHRFRTVLGVDLAVIEISINGGAWTKLDDNFGTGTNFNTSNGSIAWYNGPNNVWTTTTGAIFTGNTLGYSSQSSAWIQTTTRLTGAAGQSNVKVRMRFESTTFTFFGVDEGWEVDNIQVFPPTAPVLVTGTKTNITTSNATLSGNITSNGNSPVTASGVVFSTSPAPTRGSFGVVDSATNPLVGIGTYNVNITGLFTATTYYYRAYAVNGVGTTYGADSTFTTNSTAVVPTVLSVAATNIQAFSATLGGNITSNGGASVTASGIVYATTANPVLFGFGVVDSTTNPLIATGIYSLNPAGLLPGTKYYFRAYATNSVGTAYSTQDSFTTAPVISTFPYTENFDATTTPWTTSAINAGTNAWVRGTPAKTNLSSAFSAPNAMVTFLTGNYLGTEDCVILSPQFNFTSFTSDPVLRFRHKLKTDNDPDYDGGVIEISINNGAWTRVNDATGTGGNFNTTGSFSWYNNAATIGTLGANKFNGLTSAYSSSVNGWVESATRLTGAAGQTNVKIRFRFWADVFTDEGWAIDDIEVVNVITPTVAATSAISSSTSNTTANVSWTNGNGNGRIVVARLNSALAVAPTNNTLYTANAAFGSGSTTGTGNFIVYSGTGTSVVVTGLTSLTNYAFDVYEFNGKYMHNLFTTATTTNTSTLPVKLISFNGVAKNNDALLTWITASETNNKGFEVERSIDGRTFEYVNFVKGAGNSNKNLNYTLTDANILSKLAVVYYRLKQVDFDGKITYSQLVRITRNAESMNSMIVFPNPFNNEYNVSFNAAKAGIVTLETVNIEGKVVGTKTTTVTPGANTVPVVEAANLSAGVYFVRLTVDGETQVMKLVKN